MASRRKALWDALKALHVADTASGGLNETDGANRLFEFLLERATTRARNVPSVYVEIQSTNNQSLSTSAEQMLVRLHLFTDLHQDDEFNPQDGIADRMQATFGVVPADSGGYAFSRMFFRREFNAPSNADQMHLVQEYTVIAS